MNRRPLLFAMIVSLIISYFMYKNLMQKQQLGTGQLPPAEALIPKIPTKPVVVAKVRIPAKTRLEDPYIREALEIKQMNASDVPIGAFDNVASVTDRYTAITILPKDVITTERLLDKKLVPNLSFAIPEGKRAYTVMVDKVRGVAGFVQQGDIVDIVGFFKQGGDTEPVSRIVLQDLPVLAVGQTYEFDSAVATTAPTINAAKFDLVTLAVDPTHVEYLS
ncbi:MAG TPA: Flp pilus assembly protein CpaB, partial [Candidatus Ozemobacteraceae bacterium]|nr:Flp pilus assembly protein CpaB [Candidatus Ozemobacteraceae bacterium]